MTYLKHSVWPDLGNEWVFCFLTPFPLQLWLHNLLMAPSVTRAKESEWNQIWSLCSYLLTTLWMVLLRTDQCSSMKGITIETVGRSDEYFWLEHLKTEASNVCPRTFLSYVYGRTLPIWWTLEYAIHKTSNSWIYPGCRMSFTDRSGEMLSLVNPLNPLALKSRLSFDCKNEAFFTSFYGQMVTKIPNL